jgi:hypothetical protein
MRLRLLPLPLVLLAVLMAGCGGDGDDEPSGAASEADLTGKGEAALRASVQAFSDAFLTGEGADAHALLTARCKEALPETGFSAVVTEAGDLYGEALEFTSYEAKIHGTKAKATYTYENSDLNQKDEPWVLEGDRWLQDDC